MKSRTIFRQIATNDIQKLPVLSPYRVRVLTSSKGDPKVIVRPQCEFCPHEAERGNPHALAAIPGERPSRGTADRMQRERGGRTGLYHLLDRLTPRHPRMTFD